MTEKVYDIFHFDPNETLSLSEYIVKHSKLFIALPVRVCMLPKGGFGIFDENNSLLCSFEMERCQEAREICELLNERFVPKLDPKLFSELRFMFSMRVDGILRCQLGMKYVGDLVVMSEADLMRVRGFGRKCLDEVKEVLAAEFGLRLGMKIPNWPPHNIEELALRYSDHY